MDKHGKTNNMWTEKTKVASEILTALVADGCVVGAQAGIESKKDSGVPLPTMKNKLSDASVRNSTLGVGLTLRHVIITAAMQRLKSGGPMTSPWRTPAKI